MAQLKPRPDRMGGLQWPIVHSCLTSISLRPLPCTSRNAHIYPVIQLADDQTTCVYAIL